VVVEVVDPVRVHKKGLMVMFQVLSDFHPLVVEVEVLMVVL
jgi:hypothetical protein